MTSVEGREAAGVMAVHCDMCDVHIAAESHLEQHINGRRHQFMLAQLRQRLCARRSVFVRGFLYGTTSGELGAVFGAFGGISQVIVNQEKGLFAIVEFESEESAQKALLRDREIELRGRRLMVKPRRVKWAVAPPGDDHDNDNSGNVEQSAEDLRARLLSKLAGCSSVEEQFQLLVAELELTTDDHAVRTEICQELETFLQPTFRGCSVHQFGSSANNLGIRGCDMDLFLHIPDGDVDAENYSVKETAAASIKQIAQILRRCPKVGHVLCIPRARCPVVKFVHVSSAIKCDISVNNRLAQGNTELLQFLTAFDVRIRRLLYVVRYWAKLRGLTGSGVRLTNYALTLLVLCYLQSLKDPLLPSIDRMSQLAEEKCTVGRWDGSFTTDASLLQHNNSMSTAELLAGFFQFYAKFDFRAVVLCPRVGRAVDMTAFREQLRNDTKLSRFKVSMVSVQDPFVLDHNTTSNVSEKMRCNIVLECRRASARCHKFAGRSDGIGAQHAGIVELLSDSGSSAGSPALSLQSSPCPQQAADESAASVDVHEEAAHIQLFLLHHRCPAEPATAAAADPPRAEAAGQGRSSVEVECRVCDGFSWYRDVVGVVVRMLADIFVMDCVARDQPSEELDMQLGQLLTARANRSQVVSNARLATSDQGGCPCSPTQSDCTVEDDQLNSHRKHLSEDSSEDASNNVDAGDDDPRQLQSDCTAAKRHKPSNGASSGSSVAGSHQSSTTDVLLCVDCTAWSRTWVGRKKVRRQFLHYPDELKRQLEMTSAMRSKIAKCDQAVLEFQLAVVHPPHCDVNDLVFAVLPSRKTSKEFGCFITYFISLLQKLVNNITVEGPVVPK